MNIYRKFQYDLVYMNMATVMGSLSYASRKKVGSIILDKNGQIISQGFNGTPYGYDNKCEIIEKIDSEQCVSCRLQTCDGCKNLKMITRPEVLHAETNAISKCNKFGSGSTNGATIYVSLSPCFDCAKLIIQSGIKRVVFNELYRVTDGLNFLIKCGVVVNMIKDNHTLVDFKLNNKNELMAKEYDFNNKFSDADIFNITSILN